LFSLRANINIDFEAHRIVTDIYFSIIFGFFSYKSVSYRSSARTSTASFSSIISTIRFVSDQTIFANLHLPICCGNNWIVAQLIPFMSLVEARCYCTDNNLSLKYKDIPFRMKRYLDFLIIRWRKIIIHNTTYIVVTSYNVLVICWHVSKRTHWKQ